jgi:predicted permease
MNARDWHLRVRALVFRRHVEQELDEELAFHIERETRNQIAAGLRPAEARAAALSRFGSVALAADRCRDARGIGWVDALTQDIQYALRTFRRAPLAALTVVATVALGLGLVGAVFTAFSELFLRPDAVRSPDELFAVERPPRPGSNAVFAFTIPEYRALARDAGDYADSFALLRPIRARIDGRAVTGTLVSGTAFRILGVNAALGRMLTTADDDLSTGHLPLLLSDRGWRRLFDADTSVVGRQVRINGIPWHVVGVMPRDFRGLAIGPPDFWAPLSLAGQFRDVVDDLAVEVVARPKPGLSPEAAATGLTLWSAGHPELRTLGGREIPIRLRANPGTLRADATEAVLAFSPLFFAFGLILLIGCANVANLQLARGVVRQREIGVRLALGAPRRRVVRQLLTESVLLALAAAVCALAVSNVVLRGAIRAVAATMPPETIELVSLSVPAVDWRVVLFLVLGAIVSTALFGLAPALSATRLELVRSVRGEVTRDGHPRRARHVLIAAQVCAAALLLICAGVFLRSAGAAAGLDPGVRTSDSIRVSVRTESGRSAMLRAATAHPLVSGVAAVSWRTLAVAEAGVPGAPGTSSRVPVDRIAASSDYFGMLGLSLVRGRFFTAAERTEDAGVVILSEAVARQLWPGGDAVGQVVRPETSASGAEPAAAPVERAATVVGVLRDVTGPLAVDLFPSTAVYVPAGPETPGTSVMLRVRGDPERARQVLVDDLARADPGLGEVVTMQTIAAMPAYILRVAFAIVVVLGGLALVLTVSGLFSVLSYMVEQWGKDIAIRMALGATKRRITSLVLGHVMRPVGFGLAAGSALAAALATILLATPAAADIGNVVRVLDPVAYASAVLVILAASLAAASVPTRRAVRLDPMVTLRNE